ncbi:uncharacterized protein LOC108344423 [Vigna angularis]|uniref:uncharacterized protein LOC108344423 n=1 Tax=Phaseolus angularis TaxID=3914 RepID=UPI00080A63E4|nr:uncharacterized protein LOC108344423 [Vigna angularis]
MKLVRVRVPSLNLLLQFMWLQVCVHCVSKKVSKKDHSKKKEEMVFDVSLHHMGKLMKNKEVEYVRGERHVIKGIDPDMWSYFEAVGFVRKFKYDADFKLWWKESKQKAMNNLRILKDDSEAMLLANYAEENNDERHMKYTYKRWRKRLLWKKNMVMLLKKVTQWMKKMYMLVGVEGNVEVEDILMDDEEEEGNVEEENVEKGEEQPYVHEEEEEEEQEEDEEEEQEQEGNMVEG